MAERRSLRFWFKAGFVLALIVTVFFAGRLVLSAIYWSDPKHQDQAIEPWMTPGYVAHSWQVPKDEVAGFFDAVPGRPQQRKTLNELAQERGVPVDDLIAEFETAIAAYRAKNPRPQE